ncbi:hypothetical protein BX666DRAFT_2030388 [Dichotomocladium elegans]|nr:hypothetical protein BX666DRAFT_2030388 [Dichotomocladium elegans]
MQGESNTPASLKLTLEKSKLLTSRLGQQDLQPIERGFDHILSQTHNLNSKSSSAVQDPSNVNIRAHYFLSKARANTQVFSDLETIQLGTASEHRQPIQDTDVEGYIAQERTRTVADTIHKCKQEIMDDNDRAFDQDIRASWRSLRSKLCQGYSTEDAKVDMGPANQPKPKVDFSRVGTNPLWGAQ